MSCRFGLLHVDVGSPEVRSATIYQVGQLSLVYSISELVPITYVSDAGHLKITGVTLTRGIITACIYTRGS